MGDRVFFTMSKTGSYAEQTVVDQRHVHPLGPLSTEQGAAIGMPYFTAYRALFHRFSASLRGHLFRVWAKSGETVLVHGASGGTGMACVQMARAYGLTVIGTAGTDTGLELIVREGCQHAYNHR